MIAPTFSSVCSLSVRLLYLLDLRPLWFECASCGRLESYLLFEALVIISLSVNTSLQTLFHSYLVGSDDEARLRNLC